MRVKSSRQHESGTDIAPDKVVEKQKLLPPPLYKILILNDDFTPMDFVVFVLERFFYMSRARATQIMLQVHETGQGLCGIYSRDVAETKVQAVEAYARSAEHPLRCIMEEN